MLSTSVVRAIQFHARKKNSKNFLKGTHLHGCDFQLGFFVLYLDDDHSLMHLFFQEKELEKEWCDLQLQPSIFSVNTTYEKHKVAACRLFIVQV